MAIEYKSPTDNSIIEESLMVQDIARILDVKPEQIISYDHCKSLEELEFEMFTNMVKEGNPIEEAKKLSSMIAKDLWEASEKAKIE